MIRFPAPLRPGDTIAVTAPSAGAEGAGAERVAFCVEWLRDQGYVVVVGDCMDGSGVTSAPAERRAAELTEMLCDPGVRCVLPPWGGETAIDLVDLLDWARLAAAEPTWLVGYSDLSTILLPVTTRLGWATLHGDNLVDTPYAVPDGLLSWMTLASGLGPHVQRASGLVAESWPFEDDPTAVRWREIGKGRWGLHGADSLDVSGRLIGGCIETVANLAGTPYGDVAAFGEEHADEGLIVYLEAAEDSALSICRNLHALRLAGWFEHAQAILVGRTRAPDTAGMTQDEAVLDALGRLGLPIVLDLEIGHVAPHLPLVNGALATVAVDGRGGEIVQELR
ncbi:MAG: S66 family peptidase [Marmoricola sp.]